MRACVRSCVRACVRYTCVLRLDRNGLSVSHSLLRSFFGSTSREGRPSIPPLSGVPPLGQTERPRSIYLAYGSLPGKTLKISPFVSPFLRTSPCFLRAIDSFLPSFAPQRVRTVVNKRRPTLRRLFPRFRNPFAISRKSFSRNGVSSNAFSMGTSGTIRIITFAYRVSSTITSVVAFSCNAFPFLPSMLAAFLEEKSIENG